jgi:hypothetical protein
VSGEEWLKKHEEKGDLSGGWVSTYPALEKGLLLLLLSLFLFFLLFLDIGANIFIKVMLV